MDQDWVTIEGYVSPFCQDGVEIRSQIKHQNYNKMQDNYIAKKKDTNLSENNYYKGKYCEGISYHRHDFPADKSVKKRNIKY